MTYPHRRRFLKVMGATAAGCVACGGETAPPDDADGGSSEGGMGGMGGAEPMGGTGGMGTLLTQAGNVADVMVGQVVPVLGTQLLIGRDAGGIYAMSSLCTHNNCDLTTKSVISTDIRCTCHNSRFTFTGTVLMGPAQNPLRHYAVTIDTDGTILVDKMMVVDASTRAPVP